MLVGPQWLDGLYRELQYDLSQLQAGRSEKIRSQKFVQVANW